MKYLKEHFEKLMILHDQLPPINHFQTNNTNFSNDDNDNGYNGNNGTNGNNGNNYRKPQPNKFGTTVFFNDSDDSNGEDSPNKLMINNKYNYDNTYESAYESGNESETRSVFFNYRKIKS